MEIGNTRPIRVLVADDHPAVRKGLQIILAAESGIELVAEAVNGREAVAKTMALVPDVVLMDLMMPELDGIGATLEITQRCPGTAVIIFTAFGNDEENAMMASSIGAVGYMSKDGKNHELIEVIKAAYQRLAQEDTTHLRGGERNGKHPDQGF
jgi:DNA-binding NarL/FixJ family response regulator